MTQFFYQTLNGKHDETKGGVVILITDGMEDCRDPNELNIDDPRLINRVKNTKVRIITVAFG